MNIKPLFNNVLIERLKAEEKTESGIFLPSMEKEKSEQGVVVAVGEGKKTDDGKMIPLTVKVGQKVVFGGYGFKEVKAEGKEYIIIPESDIVAILE